MLKCATLLYSSFGSKIAVISEVNRKINNVVASAPLVLLNLLFLYFMLSLNFSVLQIYVLDVQKHITGVIIRQLEGFGSWEGDNKHSWLFERQCGFVGEGF